MSEASADFCKDLFIKTGKFVPMDYREAAEGSQLIADGILQRTSTRRDEWAPSTRRLIERLLDQLDERRRAATYGEDLFLRQAIHAYSNEKYKKAVESCWWAALTGDDHLDGYPKESGRALTLRELFAMAVTRLN
ncbi:hypothetical protein [Rhodanobacter sp. L36]|uniref:hypothetical protein n=1 Tax=Rhodanobacter sp. L36 TaxID=1747221 RepID=UPI00131CD2CB|nr:hypothetical protein [Rhodanobacter sp. L36]